MKTSSIHSHCNPVPTWSDSTGVFGVGGDALLHNDKKKRKKTKKQGLSFATSSYFGKGNKYRVIPNYP